MRVGLRALKNEYHVPFIVPFIPNFIPNKKHLKLIPESSERIAGTALIPLLIDINIIIKISSARIAGTALIPLQIESNNVIEQKCTLRIKQRNNRCNSANSATY